MKTILLNSLYELNPNYEILIKSFGIVMCLGVLYALLLTYHNMYLEKQQRRNEDNHNLKMKKWKSTKYKS